MQSRVSLSGYLLSMLATNVYLLELICCRLLSATFLGFRMCDIAKLQV